MNKIFTIGKKYKSTFPGNVYTVIKRTTARATLSPEGSTLSITRPVKDSDMGEYINLDPKNRSYTLYAKDEVKG